MATYRCFLSSMSVCIIALILSGCAPRPDSEKSIEMARVYGECTFALNTAMLDMPVIDDSDERHQIIQDIVDELVRSRYTHFPWKIHAKLFDYPVPNAFTTGGGYLAAFSGVYVMADDEAALAGVIAHELSHMATFDTMEIAEYLERMLALRLQQSGLDEEYEAGTALKTVVDFCLAIPGLVSPTWKDDLVVEENSDVNESYNDVVVPHITYNYSDDPMSAYYNVSRDPNGLARVSTCNDTHRDVYDEFVVINPDHYLAVFPDSDSLPPIPEGIGGGIGGLPTAEILWKTEPWLQFQQTAFMRYAECRADEGSMLNLLASGYNPLALNESFTTMLGLFELDEKASDWRFINHPSLAQRIEDNTSFIENNADVLPALSDITDPSSDFRRYIILADQEAEFQRIRDVAREELFGVARTSIRKNSQVKGDAERGSLEDFEPITVADLAMLLIDELSASSANTKQKTDKAVPGAQKKSGRCDAFSKVYKQLTGKENHVCLPVE